MKKGGRNRRLRQRHRSPPVNPATLDLDLSSFASQMVHDNQSGPLHPRAPRGGKGKHRESPIGTKTPVIEESISKPQAWFLDVANPTWADLRAIGKVLSSIFNLQPV